MQSSNHVTQGAVSHSAVQLPIFSKSDNLSSNENVSDKNREPGGGGACFGFVVAWVSSLHFCFTCF